MFHIDNRSRVPIHQQLQAQIVRYVSLGLLLPDQQLPSVRAMAQQLGINPNTVQKAYAALEMNGVLYTVAGRGAFISPEKDQLSQFKKLAADRFAAACTRGGARTTLPGWKSCSPFPLTLGWAR